METIQLEFPAFLELYDLVNERVVKASVPSKPDVRLSVFADRSGPFNCPVLQGDVLPNEPLRCFYEMSTAVYSLEVYSLEVRNVPCDKRHDKLF